jgi:hypothetical protein
MTSNGRMNRCANLSQSVFREFNGDFLYSKPIIIGLVKRTSVFQHQNPDPGCGKARNFKSIT